MAHAEIVENPAGPGLWVGVSTNRLPPFPSPCQGLLGEISSFLTVATPQVGESDELFAVVLEEPLKLFLWRCQRRSPLVRSHRFNAREVGRAAFRPTNLMSATRLPGSHLLGPLDLSHYYPARITTQLALLPSSHYYPARTDR
jgi:hypothetical protein